MGWFSNLFSSYGFLVLVWMLLLLIVGLVMRWRQILGFRIKKQMVWILLGILILALGVRLISPWGMDLGGETSDYLGFALQYSETGELDYDRHPPGFSFLLAFMISFGAGYTGLVIFSLVLGLLSVVLGFILGKEVTHSDLGGYVVAVLIGFHSTMISSSVTIWRDGGLAFFGILTLLLWMRLMKGKDVGVPFVISFVFLSLIDLRALVIIFPLGMIWAGKRNIAPLAYLSIGLLIVSPFIIPLFEKDSDSGERDQEIYGRIVEYDGLFSLRYLPTTIPLLTNSLMFSSYLPLLIGIFFAGYIILKKKRLLYLPVGLGVAYAAVVTFWGFYFFRGGVELSLFLIFLFLIVAYFFKEFLSKRSIWVKIGAVVVLGLTLLTSYIDGEPGPLYPDLELEEGVLLTVPGNCDCTLPLSTFLSFALPGQELVFYSPDDPLPEPPYRVLRFTDSYLARPAWIAEQDEMFEALGILTLTKERTVRGQTIYLVTHNDHKDS